ncbi:MAG: amino acid permease [Saprospiraceae bacterium]|nr:amino acid permease [Saprospiraceae bacterium]
MSDLLRKISTFGLTMIAVGACIGSGIFLTPSMIAESLMSETGVIAIWAFGGFVALCGALSFAELGVRFPRSGGVYVFLRECYGELVAFLYGWTILTVVTSGAIAALSLAFARYIDFLVPLGQNGMVILAIAGIIVVTVINVRGVDHAEMFSNIFTVVKLIGIVVVAVSGLIWATEAIDWRPALNLSDHSASAAFSGAMIGIVWSFGGWHHASYVAGEVRDPQRSVPRAMILGTIIVTVMYVLANLAYLYLLGVEGMATSTAVASDALSGVFSFGAVLVAVLIAISTFGSKGIYTLTAPRIYFAMAKDGVFFKQLAQVHPKFNTPALAILLQSGWAIILVIFWQTFENIITYVVFMDWVFMALATITIFYFRKRYARHPKYSTPLYPVTPIIFIVISSAFLIVTLYHQPSQALAGLFLLTIGILVFRIFYRKKHREPDSTES